MGVFWAVAIGLVAGVLIGLITEYYCSTHNTPTYNIARQSMTGAATNIISGLGIGMMSTGLPIIVLATAIIGAAYFAGLYGIAIAAVGLLSVMGIQLAVDAYGPISDNAGGIAEMAHLPPEVRQRTDTLDAVGNTTAAIGKGFAIGSAALTALALFAAFLQTIEDRRDGKAVCRAELQKGALVLAAADGFGGRHHHHDAGGSEPLAVLGEKRQLLVAGRDQQPHLAGTTEVEDHRDEVVCIAARDQQALVCLVEGRGERTRVGRNHASATLTGEGGAKGPDESDLPRGARDQDVHQSRRRANTRQSRDTPVGARAWYIRRRNSAGMAISNRTRLAWHALPTDSLPT